MVVVGLLADTHGLLDPTVLATMRAAGVSHILHAGDLVDGNGAKRLQLAEMLSHLQAVAPVTVVRGNTDDKWARGHSLPETASHSAAGVRFFMHHGDRIKDDDAALAHLVPADGWRSKGDVIVSGHSHTPRLERHRSGVTFLNPGSAGPQRFKLPRQCALVHCDAGEFTVRSIDLLAGGVMGVWDVRTAGKRAAEHPTSAAPDAPDAPLRCIAHTAQAGQLVGRVGGLFLKEVRGAPMRSVQTAELVARHGVRGDLHATPLSPRQVLLQASSAASGAAPGAFREVRWPDQPRLSRLPYPLAQEGGSHARRAAHMHAEHLDRVGRRCHDVATTVGRRAAAGRGRRGAAGDLPVRAVL